MRKTQFVMNSKITFEVDQSLVESISTFKEAIENGGIKVVNFDMDLVAENGNKYEDSTFLDLIKDAIIYGLLERG